MPFVIALQSKQHAKENEQSPSIVLLQIGLLRREMVVEITSCVSFIRHMTD